MLDACEESKPTPVPAEPSATAQSAETPSAAAVTPGGAVMLRHCRAELVAGAEDGCGRFLKGNSRGRRCQRLTWRPDIRAAVISAARVNMHRMMRKMATTTGQFPLAVLSDCVVYPAPGPSPLDVLPRTSDGKLLPGAFRLGVNPGFVKHEGTQPMAWALELLAEGLNPARHIKGDGHDAVLIDGECE